MIPVRGLALALAFSFAACGAPRPAVLFGPAPDADEVGYHDVLATWTRSDKLYDRLDNILFITATYHAPELRRAFAAAFPEVYGHGGDVTRRELIELPPDVERHHTFFVVAYTPDRSWNDIDQPDSIWRMTLVNDEDQGVGPTQITLVKIDENLRRVYPYIGRFDKAYLVRFPLNTDDGEPIIRPGTRSFNLRTASALGTSEVKWELTTPSGDAPQPDPS